MLALTKLTDAFAAIVSAEEVPNGKPSPDVFLEAAKRLNCPPDQCVVLEDAHNGILAAHAAGMKCIGVRHAQNTDADLDGADRKVPSMEDVSVSLIAGV
jgi:beta-phosphoglucomutase-like phosphatase (HAD superfamily)